MQANSALQGLLFCFLLLTASVWDVRKRIIPNSLCTLLFLTGLLCFQPANLLGILIALPLFIAALCKPGGMGGGDIKLTAAAGTVLGFEFGVVGLAPSLSVGFLAAYFMNFGGFIL